MKDNVQSAVRSRGFLGMSEMLFLLPIFAAFFAANQRSMQLLMCVRIHVSKEITLLSK